MLVNVTNLEGQNILEFCKDENSWKIILEHLAEIRSLDLHVNPSIHETILKNKNYSDYFEKCLEELVLKA